MSGFFAFKGADKVARKRKKKISYSLAANQPAKCKGCVWGEWRETKQLCLRVKCVKN